MLFRFKKRKNEKEVVGNRIFLKIKVETYNLNNGDEAIVKGKIGFDKKVKLGDAIDIIDQQFNLNEIRGDYTVLTNNLNELWKQHGFKDIGNINMDLKKYKLKDLNKMFDLGNFTFKITLGGGTGGECGRVRGMRFVLYPGESKQHHGIHIHVKKSGEEISVDLEELRVIRGKFKNKKDVDHAIRYIERNKEGLINEWYSLRAGITHNAFKMSFDN